MLWGNTSYCVKLIGEDLSRYSSKTEPDALRKCPCYQYLTKKCDVTVIKRFSEFAYIMAGNSRHRYGMNKLRYCQSPYVYIGWSDVTVICHLYVVGQHGELDEDL